MDDDDMIEAPIQQEYGQRYEGVRLNTQRVLEKNKQNVLSFPRYIREALYNYTRDEMDQSARKDIEDAFNAIEPIDESITVFRGVRSTHEDVRLQFSDFISSSASIDVAKDFREDSPCCLFIINVPAGSKVLYIPKDIHYEDDDEEEILLQGGGTLNVLSEEREGEFIVNYVVPFATKFNVSRLSSIKKEMETIEEMNSFATILGAKKWDVINDNLDDVAKFIETHSDRAAHYYEVLMKELTPYPFEIAMRPFSELSASEKFLVGEAVQKEWDIPKGSPFSRISVFFLFLLISIYPNLAPASTRSTDIYKALKSLCDHLHLSSDFVFDRLGAFVTGSHSYYIALEFDIPVYTDSDYVKHFVDLLMEDKEEKTRLRRIQLLTAVAPFCGITLKLKIKQAIRRLGEGR